jgi:hypothetical protein
VVNGWVSEYNGNTEVTAAVSTLRFWGSGSRLPVIDTMVADQPLTEAMEGSLVTVSGTVTRPPQYAWNGGGYDMQIHNCTMPVELWLPEISGFPLPSLMNGVKIQVIGIITQTDTAAPYDAGYQIIPRFAEAYAFDGTPHPADIIILTGTSSRPDGSASPARAWLHQNAPNPFTRSTTVSYQLAKAGVVNLSVYNVAGQRVRTLVDSPQPAGCHTARWDGNDQCGRAAAAGVYLYQLQADGIRMTKKMTVLR